MAFEDSTNHHTWSRRQGSALDYISKKSCQNDEGLKE